MDIRTKETIKVAYYYYNLGFNQQDIADKLGMSRQRVNRLLKRALQDGIVEIKVHGYDESNLNLEGKLESKFGLKEALVVDSGENNSFGIACINYLDRNIETGSNIGITFGSTIAQVCNGPDLSTYRLPRWPFHDISVIQMLGGINSDDIAFKPDGIANRVASLFGGNAYSLFVPAIVDNMELKNLFNYEYRNNEIMNKYSQIDMAVVGIGAFNEDNVLIKNGYLNRENYEFLLSNGCVGDVCFRFINIKGEIVDSEFQKRIMGISDEDYHSIKLRIGMAYGQQKVKPIIAAINGKYINVLITDVDTGQLLLNYSEGKD